MREKQEFNTFLRDTKREEVIKECEESKARKIIGNMNKCWGH